MRAAGMPNGVYSLGGQTVYMTDGKATLEDGTIAGSATYMVLYLGKSFIEGMLLGSALGPVLLSVATKAVTSGVNAVIAVIVSVPLCAAIRLALKKSHLLEKLG